MLSEKKLCFNCTGSQHQAGRCKSKKNCGKCNGRHHTSICDDTEQPPEPSPPSDGSTRQPLLVSKESSVVYPAVIVQVNGVKCRAVLDTMAGSSYVSAGLLDYIGAKDFRTTTRAIEMMFQTVKKKINIYNLTIQNSEGTPIFESEFTKVDRKELLHLPNPNYEKLKKQYRHLSAVTIRLWTIQIRRRNFRFTSYSEPTHTRMSKLRLRRWLEHRANRLPSLLDWVGQSCHPGGAMMSHRHS